MIANALHEHRANAVQIATGAEAENAVERSVAKRIVDDLRYDAECRAFNARPLIELILAKPKTCRGRTRRTLSSLRRFSCRRAP